jgi:undecaprenyl-diphosphatase
MVALIAHIFIQIVFESLPVSSSGHVLLFSRVARAMGSTFQTVVVPDGFDFVLHGSTIVLVGLYFFTPWWQYLCDIVRGKRYALQIALLCIIADLITAVWFVLFKLVPIFDFPLWVGFAVTTYALFATRWIKGPDRTELTLKDALVLGCVQGLALLPGISRFGATLACARWLGFSWSKSGEYSWLIAWPLMAAGLMWGSLAMYRAGTLSQLVQPPVACSILIATCFSWVVYRLVMKSINRGHLWKFGWYLIIPLLCAVVF